MPASTETNTYQGIISCPLGKPLRIPFPFPGDSSQRYTLAAPLPPSSLSPYATVDNRQYFSIPVLDTDPSAKTILDQNLETIDDFEKESLKQAGIPELAFIYLTLAEHNPTVPELLDAWLDKESDQEIVIIGQHSNARCLSEYWQQQPPKPQQVLDLLKHMVKLWRVFSKLNCRNSLLVLENLKTEDGENLLLDRIYLDAASNPPLLRQLVQTWADLLLDLDEKYQTWIEELMTKIESGVIESAKQLRSELDGFSQQLEIESFLEEESLNIPSEDDVLKTVAEAMGGEEAASVEATRVNLPEEGDEQPTLVLPMRLFSVADAALSDVGRRRTHNEDYFAMETSIRKSETTKGTYVSARGLYIVCDGMGGHASGEVASAAAVQFLTSYFEQHWTENQLPSEETIRKGILMANDAIFALNQNKGQVGAGRMGTTVAMVLLQDTKVAIAHVGDSRVYRVTRKWGLEQLTRDHSVAQMEIQQGVEPEIAYGRADAHQLTQALGPRDSSHVHPEIQFFDIKEDTLLVLCSDGLYDNNLLENHWEKTLLPLISSRASLDEGASQLIDLGNQINGHDNLTCVLVRIKVQPHLEGMAGFYR
ncbi:MAG TPA: serine/threonine phosphatase [Geminocystis sp. M7585_C2015_104]|nr:serine/threonine phosphatase [Geminocystis sp. M7585_C2015_104]